jgi:hypothetical protein
MKDTLTDIALPVAAIALSLVLFGGFVWFAGVSPVEVWVLLFKGAFGDWFSWQNTLQRAAPLMLTALCVAIPARAGLVIIGGEGAMVLGGLACAALPYVITPPANMPWHGAGVRCRRGGRCAVDHAGGLSAAVSRHQRNHLQPAAGLCGRRPVQAPGSRARCATRPA